ncbi:hypothetical protein [Ramlibacter sp. Leaf400]|uniref:hypothetical protein n=1 Tax=Ramlibacter sp. Leaf400 TaxID=1736365 RepID=UPI0009E99EB3|nr:hypothetical protein [Ramlibacter sp. Leaf400]
MTGHVDPGYFDLQVRFAERYAALIGIPLHEAIGRCTNLRRRFAMVGPSGHDRWAAFLDGVQACSHHDDVLRIVMDTHDSAPTRSPSPFGCFSYDAPDAQGTLRLHFMPEERHRCSSPLAASSLSERRAELQALFTDVRQRHPEVRQVRGLSWLYHVRAYRNLFPPPYAASVAAPIGPLHLTGSSTWGQVLDYRHRLRRGIADRVLEGLSESTVSAPWQAFPVQPLTAVCSADHWFRWFE